MHVIHLVSEYWPFARTGGLAEAVRGIAGFQAQSGTPTGVFMPLYRVAREQAGALVPACDDVTVTLGRGRVERGRILKQEDPPEGPVTYFVEHDGFFDRNGVYGDAHGDFGDNHLRYAFFVQAVLAALPQVVTDDEVVLHPHDWHAALAPVYLREVLGGQRFYDRVACILSVHNAGYQGLYGPQVLDDIGLPHRLFHWSALEYYGQVNWLKGGLAYADWVTTVSPTHAFELRTPAGGFGLHDFFIGLGDRLVGILNGIDVELWDPSTDEAIPARYSREDLSGKAVCKASLQEDLGLPVDPDVPLVGMTARLARQKGFDLLLQDGLLYRLPEAQFVFLGEGDRYYRDRLAEVSHHLPDRVATCFDFTEHREHLLLAGADILLMPSLYEPCGLTQMRAQRYGALPVVRKVGGLSDTVDDQETGFVFGEYTSYALEVALKRAFALYPDRVRWQAHMTEAMSRDFGWARSADRYLKLYRDALEAHLEDEEWKEVASDGPAPIHAPPGPPPGGGAPPAAKT